MIILIFLGIIQGLAEFLPVSSSGHLALLETVFHFNQTQKLSYTAFLHIGTALALIYFFRKKIIDIFTKLFSKNIQQKKDNFSLIIKIIIGTIPIGVIGYLAQDKIDLLFNKPIFSAIFLIITGVILYSTRFTRATKMQVSYLDAILIGIAQAIALLPGISRSGITISLALLLGLSQTEGFEFSFLLSIPAVIGANILMFKDVSINLDRIKTMLAIAVPFIVGVLALRILKSIIIKKHFHNFAYYCWLVGLLAIILIVL